MPTTPFSDEQVRTVINLRQHYEVWIDAERALAAMPYDLRRKNVGGRAYLYEITDRSGNGRSLGPWSDERETQFTEYREDKAAAKQRRDVSRAQLEETSRQYRALRLPLLASPAGAILRECDRRYLLGAHLLVVGTNAMPAYHLEAAGFIHNAPDETLDLDLAWSGQDDAPLKALVWPMLKAVDSTFTVNSERDFQARNAKAYEVELLAAPSTLPTLSRADRLKPIPLEEQEWLLLGKAVDQVVVCRDGTPARIVAPDPRWFALQKLWLSTKDRRAAIKKPKDARQGLALLDAIWTTMSHYPIDDAFEADLPQALRPPFGYWQDQRPAKPRPRW